MKKQVKDLTIGEIKMICKNTSKVECNKGNCPLFKHLWLCLGLRNMKKKEMESEVEFDD